MGSTCFCNMYIKQSQQFDKPLKQNNEHLSNESLVNPQKHKCVILHGVN
jgi:hypothetical protein